MIIDTHCHLDFKEFDSDRGEVIERAQAAGVLGLINVGSSVLGSRRSVELASKYDSVFASVGVHPHHAGEVKKNVFAEMTALARGKKVVAIGEVGLDYFNPSAPPEEQKELFISFIELSKKLALPLIIHTRNAYSDTMEILKTRCEFPVKGVMHCFSGDKKELGEVLQTGLFISFTSNLTFKNAKSLRDVAKCVNPERLLLETDAPYLAPQIHRGKRNEPAYITELRDTLSGLLGIPKEEVERITTDNAKRLFGIGI